MPPEVTSNEENPRDDRRTCGLCRVLHEGRDAEKGSVGGQGKELEGENEDVSPAEGDMRCFVNLWSKVQSAAWHVNACLAVLRLTTPATQLDGCRGFVVPVDPLSLRPALALKLFFGRETIRRLWGRRRERDPAAAVGQTAPKQSRILQQATSGVCRRQQRRQQQHPRQQQDHLQNNTATTAGPIARGGTQHSHDQRQHGGATTVNASAKPASSPPQSAGSKTSKTSRLVKEGDTPAACADRDLHQRQEGMPVHQCRCQRKRCCCRHRRPTGAGGCPWVCRVRTVLDAASFAYPL